MAADTYGLQTLTDDVSWWTSAVWNTHETSSQAEFERRTREFDAEACILSGLTPTIDAGNDEIDVAAGVAYCDGYRYVGNDSIAFTTEADDTYYIYWLASTGVLTKATDGTGWPASAHVKICEVTWVLSTTTLSALVDRRYDHMRRAGLWCPVDTWTLDGSNPPTLGTAGTAGQSQFRYARFDNAADDMAYIQHMCPEDVTNGNFYVWLPLRMATVTTGDVWMEGTMLAVAAGEDIDAAGAVNTTTSLGNPTVPGTAGQQFWAILEFTGVTVARFDMLSFKVMRDVTDETSSAAEGADVVGGAWITYV